MPLPPSRRDVSNLSSIVRHHDAWQRRFALGGLGGRFGTPTPVRGNEIASDLVGDDGGDSGAGSDEVLFENRDVFVIDGPGDKTFALTYVPIQEPGTSVQVFWIPLRMPRDNWTIDDNVITVTDPGWEADDLVEVAYAYEYDGEPEPSSVITDFGDSGWKWLQVPFHDPNDYSDPSFDDTAWADGVPPFGETNPTHDVAETFAPYEWPDYITVWNQNTQMWARITVAAEAGVAASVSIRLNRTGLLWWNGDYRGKTTSPEHTWDIPADLVDASNVVVFKVSDDSFSGIHTGCYFDAQISQVLEETL